MGLMFKCQYCPATFYQFKDLVRHYETRYNQEGEQYQGFQDVESYRRNDSGCKSATHYLSHQSSCLKCPFRKCVYDEPMVRGWRAKKRRRNEQIIQRFKEGKDTQSLAIAFDVSKRTIQRIVSR